MNEDLSYEEALKELDSIVGKLEKEDLPLEEAIDLFDRGRYLIKLCREKLLSAKRRVFLVKDDGSEEDIDL